MPIIIYISLFEYVLIIVGEEKWGSDEGSPLPTTTEKHCIPIIFYTNNVWRPRGRGKGLLGLQVCLVEQGSGVIEVCS